MFSRSTGSIPFALLGAVLFCLPAFSQAPSGADLDGDGRSEFVLVDIGSNQQLTWSSYSSLGASASVPVVELGKVGDHLALGNWASKTKTSLGYITVHEKSVRWNVVSDLAEVSTRTFGKKSDTFIAGGDFNSNGLTDAAIVRASSQAGGESTWIVKNDFFKHVGGAKKVSKTMTRKFGKSSDLFFFANYSGKQDWIAYMRVNPSGPGAMVRMRSLVSGKERKFKVLDYTPGTIRPLPISQANGKDVLALIRRQSASTIVQFVNLQGVTLGSVELPGVGEIVVGDYLSSSGQEIAIQTEDGFLVHNPITAEQVVVTVPSGIVVDDININVFSSEGSVGTCDDETLDPHDGPDGFLWKEKSIHNKLVILYPKEWTTYIDDAWLETADGVFIERASSLKYIQPSVNPNARTFARYKKLGKSYPANVRAVAHLKQGCYKVYQIPNPGKRYD